MDRSWGLCAYEGVDTIFGYPGGQAIPIYDKLYDYQDQLRHVLVRHEQGATHAAQGYARVSGRVGVALVTSGPGATNTITGIADAMMDSTPMVVIAGQVPSPLLGFPPYFLFFTMIGLCILAHIIRLFMLRSCVPSFTFKTYLARLAFPGIIILGMTVLMVYGVEFLDINKLIRLILSFLVSAVSTSILLYVFGVSKKERNLIREFVYRRIKL